MKNRAPEALLIRARRAEELAKSAETAAAPLRFAGALYRAQSSAAAHLLESPLSAELELDAERVVVAGSELLKKLVKDAPAQLAEEADRRLRESKPSAAAQLVSYFHRSEPRDRIDPMAAFLSRAILRPYLGALAAEHAAITGRVAEPSSSAVCPFCAGPPWIAARRSEPGSDGAARWLSCAWCGTDWIVNRILCPGCSETDPAKLPSFQGDGFPTVRIEACETCHRYVKSLDLTMDARPVPEVDELCSIALDLWAVEQGFARIEPGLAGI